MNGYFLLIDVKLYIFYISSDVFFEKRDREKSIKRIAQMW